MKLPLPLALIFSFHLLSAAPIPSKYRNILSTDCLSHASTAFQPGQRITFTSKPNTSPKTLSNPFFSSHQLLSPFSSSAFAHRAAEQSFNNAPITPPKHLDRSQALTAKVPLESSYLLSLANTATILEEQDRLAKTISATDDLAAKPTSALPYLRNEDAKRYWATLRSRSSSGENEAHDEIVASDRLVMLGSTRICADGFAIEGIYSRELTRSYDDILVGILVLFLASVIAWEAAEIIRDLNRLCGKVYSEDEETVTSIKKPFFLYRAPGSGPGIAVDEHEDEGRKGGIHAKV